MSGERVLTRRELNRALLARQLLLERRPLSAVKAVERLGGLQAQSTPSPYLSLWTRLEGFEREELTKALTGRRLVKALLQRGTLHIVTPGDYWAFSTARRELGGILWPPAYEALVPKARLAKLARARPRGARGGRAHVQGDAGAARAARARRGDADLPLAARAGARERRPRAAVRHLGLRRPRRLRGRRGKACSGEPPPAAGGLRPPRPQRTCAPTARRRSRTSASGPACRG